MPQQALSYHWRMMSFDSYDGKAWARTQKERKQLARRAPGPGRRFDLRPLTPHL